MADQSDGTLDDLAGLLARHFIQRRDVKAQQSRDGAIYHPVREKVGDEYRNLPFKMDDLRAHLCGERTFGHYLVSPDNKCKLFAFDLDLIPAKRVGVKVPGDPREVWLTDHPWSSHLTLALRTLAEGIATRTKRLFGVPTCIAFSGNKGLHVYALTGTVDAAWARRMARKVIESFGCFELARGDNFWRHAYPPSLSIKSIEIEVYPKQDNLNGKDFGNLMRLPLGIHRKTGRRSFFLALTEERDALVEDDPVLAITQGSLRSQES